MKIKFLIVFFCLMIVNYCCNISFNNVYAENLEDDCKSCIVIEKNSGKCLYENNINEKLPIASIVKLMTLYLTFEAIDNKKIDFDSIMQVSDYAASREGSQLFLDANSVHKVEDLIKSVVICSANDSAVVLAENIAGSESNFVKLMNEKAKELKMDNTLFVDSTGLNENGYSTAYDVSILASKVLDDARYKKFSKIWLDEYTHPSGRTTELVNTNKLIRQYDKCVSGKTGTTEKAGYCFTSLSNDNDFKLICVVLGAKNSDSRFKISKERFLTCYADYKFVKLYSSNDSYNRIKVKNAKEPNVNCYVKNDFGFVILRNQNYEVIEELVLLNKKAPININEEIAVLNIYVNNDFVGKVELICNEKIEKANYFDNIKKILNNFVIKDFKINKNKCFY